MTNNAMPGTPGAIDPRHVFLTAWQAVFGVSFKAPPATESKAALSASAAAPGEQFLDRTLQIPIRVTEKVRLVGRVRPVGVQRAYDLPARGGVVGKRRDIDFELRDCTVTGPFDVFWKVKNTGREAGAIRQLRGEVTKGGTSRHETTAYVGSHYVEVYIVKDGVCVARDRQPVIIQPMTRA